ncbi:MAG TPA: Rieske 2Fe-2S domain-containing protein [Chloroflexota bacterium]|nr:Rieske 2Fe-2S domain-containing protein [Chloroflexota bacterium]
MLSKEQNQLLTQTDRGTPMGELMRRYWLPALLSEEIPAPDCPPVQVRLLGEDLVAFRDTNGRIGLLAEACSHRGTSLFYGRNEEGGLRCIYHGWKYDAEGRVLDTPAEPAGSTFRQRVSHPAYPTREVGGMVFAYMGPPEREPLFPAYEWAGLPAEQCYATKAIQDCNYLQGLEGECDSSHLSFLHRSFRFELPSDTAPRYETEDTDFGVRLIALRDAPGGATYVRVSSFILPVACAVPVGRGGTSLDTSEGYEVHFYTPIDDTHSARFDFGFNRRRPIEPDEPVRRRAIGPGYRRFANAANHYLQDREKQRTENYTGMTDFGFGSFLAHDSCATESMGPLYDRSREHLGVSDLGVISVRRRLLDVVQAFQRGEQPAHVVTEPARNVMTHVTSFAEISDAANWRAEYPGLASSAEEARADVPGHARVSVASR